MVNHVHFLVSPETAESTGRMMPSLGRRYVRFVNDRYHRTGALWEGRYISTLVDTETYFFMVTIDVEMNPARADAFKASLHKVANHAPNLRAEVVIQSRRNKIKDTDPLTSTVCLTLRLLM